MTTLANQSIPTGSSGTATGGTNDNGVARQVHTAVCMSSAGISAGTFNLQVSQDGINWFAVGTAVTITASSVQVINYAGGAFQYSRAVITGVTGGTVGVTVADAG